MNVEDLEVYKKLNMLPDTFTRSSTLNFKAWEKVCYHFLNLRGFHSMDTLVMVLQNLHR